MCKEWPQTKRNEERKIYWETIGGTVREMGSSDVEMKAGERRKRRGKERRRRKGKERRDWAREEKKERGEGRRVERKENDIEIRNKFRRQKHSAVLIILRDGIDPMAVQICRLRDQRTSLISHLHYAPHQFYNGTHTFFCS